MDELTLGVGVVGELLIPEGVVFGDVAAVSGVALADDVRVGLGLGVGECEAVVPGAPVPVAFGSEDWPVALGEPDAAGRTVVAAPLVGAGPPLFMSTNPAPAMTAAAALQKMTLLRRDVRRPVRVLAVPPRRPAPSARRDGRRPAPASADCSAGAMGSHTALMAGP